jgi:hypothetical protein
MVPEWFGLKITRMVFAGLASKLVVTVSGSLASKPAAMVSSGLASKPTVMVSGMASKSHGLMYPAVWPQNLHS